MLGVLTLGRERRISRQARIQRKRRIALKRVLGEAMNYGMFLRHAKDVSEGDFIKWASHISDLIGSALGPGEENAWMDAAQLHRQELMSRQMEADLISGCNRALADLVRRVDTLDVADAFDPEQWAFRR